METTEKKPLIGKFKCFVTTDTDVSPAALKKAIPHVHRGVQYNKEDHDQIQRLFSHNPIPADMREGDWLFEQMIDMVYGFRIHTDAEVKEQYKDFDASGVLGCGEGSERFVAPTKEEVALFMGRSISTEDWDVRAAKVKEAHGGVYPDYWETMESNLKPLI